MTTVLIVLAVIAGMFGLALLIGWPLCRAADLGDQVRIEPDDSERCPVCGDPTGIRCCEFGKAA